jgi:hypothetical protein
VGAAFEAMGVSLVFHPRNPYAPTVHMNVRMLAALPKDAEPVYWFGGGMDLTPYYGFEEDARHFHATCRDALAPFGADKYPRFKAWCDDYFFLKHRNEPRGVGGIFFDDHFEGGFEASFGMLRAVGDAFLPAYLPILQKRMDAHMGNASANGKLLRPWPLRRIQPGVGPAARIRPAVGRPHRVDPDVDAAAGVLGLPGGAPSRHGGGRAAATLRRAQGLGLTAPLQRVGMFGGALRPAAPRATWRWPRRPCGSSGWDPCTSSRTGTPGHKVRTLTPAEHRLAMARLAFASVAGAVVDDRELRRAGPTYSIDTLRELRSEYPDAEPGAADGGTRRPLHRLAGLARHCPAGHLAVAQRGEGDGLAAPENPAWRAHPAPRVSPDAGERPPKSGPG